MSALAIRCQDKITEVLYPIEQLITKAKVGQPGWTGGERIALPTTVQTRIPMSTMYTGAKATCHASKRYVQRRNEGLMHWANNKNSALRLNVKPKSRNRSMGHGDPHSDQAHHDRPGARKSCTHPVGLKQTSPGSACKVHLNKNSRLCGRNCWSTQMPTDAQTLRRIWPQPHQRLVCWT